MAIEPDHARSSLSAVSISKRFGDQTAVNSVSVKVRSGELVGLIGANGGGKTTYLRMLSGLLAPDEGEVLWFGQAAKNNPSLRQKIGYMPQKLSLYGDLTVSENLAFYAAAYSIKDPARTIDDVLHELELTAFAHKRVDALSGGWARVAQLAANLLHQPSVLLLDEPTAGLDANMRFRFWRFIRSYADAGHAVIVSTHDLDESQQCDQILFFSGGDVLLSGTPNELFEKNIESIIYIKNNTLKYITKVLDNLKNRLQFQSMLGGVKLIGSRSVLEEATALLEQQSIEFEFRSPSLADVCALKLLELLE